MLFTTSTPSSSPWRPASFYPGPPSCSSSSRPTGRFNQAGSSGSRSSLSSTCSATGAAAIRTGIALVCRQRPSDHRALHDISIGRARGLIVALVVGMLAVLAAWSNVIASPVPAFVGLLGLGAVAFTARHLVRPVSQLPRALWSQPVRGRDLGWRANFGLLGAAAVSLTIALLFNLTAIAAIGGALALLIFGPIIVGHVQIHRETGA